MLTAANPSAYVAFLRAINVAGHARVAMTDLQRAFEQAGCRDVVTYIQSGNVAFVSGEGDASTLTARLVRTLTEAIPEGPGLALRTVSALARTVSLAPFHDLTPDRLVKWYVVFLLEAPRTIPRFPLVHDREALEVVGRHGPDVFVVSRRKPNGFYGFPNRVVEEAFGVSATSRNWTTVTKMLDVARQPRKAATIPPRPPRRPAPSPAAPRRSSGGRVRR